MLKKEYDDLGQTGFWDNQHLKRKDEHEEIENCPTDFAQKCIKYIKSGGVILEVGPGNGRDARYFARENENLIWATDISKEAITQLRKACSVAGENINNRILPIARDARLVPALLENEANLDAFYARSALHLNNNETFEFLKYIVARLNHNGVIAIEGKPEKNFKIARSHNLRNGLYKDNDGHIRRAWSEEDIRALCDKLGLNLIEINETTEKIQGKETHFINFIAQKK